MIWLFDSMFNYINIATFMLSAPVFTFLGQIFIFVIKIALFTHVRIISKNYHRISLDKRYKNLSVLVLF